MCRAGTPPSRRGKIFTVPEILEVLTDADFGVFLTDFLNLLAQGVPSCGQTQATRSHLLSELRL